MTKRSSRIGRIWKALRDGASTGLASLVRQGKAVRTGERIRFGGQGREDL